MIQVEIKQEFLNMGKYKSELHRSIMYDFLSKLEVVYVMRGE